MTLGFTNDHNWAENILNGTKVHTIRNDLKKRWRKGVIAQMVTGNRTKERVQFAEKEIQAVQDIVIVFDERGKIEAVLVDKKQINNYEVIASNDGLNVLDFEAWFYGQSVNDVYKGRLIHWTNLLY